MACPSPRLGSSSLPTPCRPSAGAAGGGRASNEHGDARARGPRACARAAVMGSACHRVAVPAGRRNQAGRDRARDRGDRLAPGTPEPSRRPTASGRSTGAPLAAAARAGRGSGPREDELSSPLRKRWQRTPPVARPLAGYSANGVTLTEPASVPGSAVEDPATVTTTASAGVERAERHDLLAGGEPDAGHAATGAPLRPHLGGREVQQLGVAGDEAESLLAGAQLDRADDLVAVLERDDVPVVPAERLRVDPLHHALPGAEREARGSRGRAGQRQQPARRLEGEELADRRPPCRWGSLAVRRQRRQVEHAELDHPAAGGDHADLAAGGRARPRRRSRRAWRGRRRCREGRRSSCGPAGRWRRGRRSRGRRRPRAERRAVTAACRRTPAGPCGAACRRSWPPRPARRRPPSGAACRRRGSRRARRWCARSSSCSFSSSILENFVSRRSGMSRM